MESSSANPEVWVKLLNLSSASEVAEDYGAVDGTAWAFRPTILRSIVQSVIPAEKKRKVCAIEE